MAIYGYSHKWCRYDIGISVYQYMYAVHCTTNIIKTSYNLEVIGCLDIIRQNNNHPSKLLLSISHYVSILGVYTISNLNIPLWAWYQDLL